MRTTLAQVRASRIPGVVGLCSTSQDLNGYVNEAQQRLLPKAKWWNTFQRVAICTNSGNITWPRSVATVEAVSVCNQPIFIRNGWFEYIENGIGIQQRDTSTGSCCRSGGMQLFDRGTSCLIEDIEDIKKLRVYIDNADDVDKRILIKAKDENGNKIYTEDAGLPVEGFYITFTVAPLLTTQLVTEIYGIVKDTTLGNVRVYQYNASTTAQSLILNAEPYENTPNYRRSLIPNLSKNRCCTPCDPDDETKSIIIAEVKLEFIPVMVDTDFLLISWIPALKEMCQSIFYAENDSLEAKQKAAVHEARAVAALDDELAHYMGDGVVTPIAVDEKTWGNFQPAIY